MDMSNLEEFTRAYITCALWSSTDDNSEPLDAQFDRSDIAEPTKDKMQEDCKDFIESNLQDLQNLNSGSCGHDFWLTRNGHGTGFWDRGYGVVGERLTSASRAYDSCDLYVGDDGKLYI